MQKRMKGKKKERERMEKNKTNEVESEAFTRRVDT